MLIKQSSLERIILSLYLALSLPLITILIHINPSKVPPDSPFSGISQALFLALFLFLLVYVIFYSIQILRVKVFIISFVFLAALTFVLAGKLHRDYYTYIFQLILSFWIVFIRAEIQLYSNKPNKTFYSVLYGLTLSVFIVFSFWLLIMGYSVALRKEPRWIEAIYYNAYNMGFIFLLITLALRLRSYLYRIVSIKPEAIIFDGYNFTQYLGEVNYSICIEFLKNPGKNVLCEELEPYLVKANNPKSLKWSCDSCSAKDITTSQCPKYKNIYNRVLEIKKLLETLEIGTIIAPKNKMKIRTEGWKLRLFDDVRIDNWSIEMPHS